MQAQRTQALRLPGRVYEQFVQKAQAKLDADVDVDICDALSRPRIKRRGSGYTVFIPMSFEQVLVLASWVQPHDPKLLRDYAHAMALQVMEQTSAAYDEAHDA